MNVKFDISSRQVKRAIKDLRQIKNGAPVAVIRAINRTLGPVRTAISREVGKEYNLKASMIKEHLKITKAVAKLNRFWGEVRASGRPIKLIHWAARQTKKGVTARILKSKPRLLYKRAWIHRGGFAAVKTRTAHRRSKTGRWSRSGAQIWDTSIEVVFQREPDAGRLPIGTPFGPSVPAAVENRIVMDRIEKDAQARFGRELLSRIDELLIKNGYPPKHRSAA